MAQTPFDRLRELGASYWKPALMTVSAVVAGLNSAKEVLNGLGISTDKLPLVASSPVARWGAVIVFVSLLVLVRFQRLGFTVTRFLLGSPKAPSAAGRIFRGPRPYGSDDVLPGRQAEIDDCWGLIQERPFLVLEGESGCGKTSFLNAGLLRKARERFHVVETRIAADPFGKLHAALAGQPYGASALAKAAAQLPSSIVASSRPPGADTPRPLLVCVDQLEELFVTCPDTVRGEFLAILRDSVNAGHLRLLLAIRSDFLDLLLKLCRVVDPAQKALDLGSYYTLSAFKREQAVAVLAQLLAPIPRDNPLIEQQLDDFTEALVGDLLRSPRDRRLCPADEKTVLPVELQTVGVMLEAVGLEYFSVGGVRRLGGKLGLLQRYIDDAKTYVWRKTGVAADRALLILRELVSPAQTKWAQSSRVIARKHALPEPQVDAVLGAFADRYLVVRLPADAAGAEEHGDPSSARYELMHEHLVHLLLEAPDPLLQKVRAAEERLAFWTIQAQTVFVASAPAGVGWRSRAAARLRQPIPLLETLRLWRYARGPESRRVLQRNLARFGTRAAVAVGIVALPYLLVTAVQRALPIGHYPVNPVFATGSPREGYRVEAVFGQDPAADELMIVVSFSGAGMRAAALSYGVLRKMRQTEIVWRGQRRRLLDEIDVVYGSSGGSLTAAYYGLFGDRTFDSFQPSVLHRNFQTEFRYRMANPLTLFRLNSPHFGRSDLLAEMYDETIFEGRTFNHLREQRRRPFLVIGATDADSGTRFEFTQDYFDLLCSDLSGVPVGRAVAASMTGESWGGTPVILKNYAPCSASVPPMELWNLRERGDASLQSREAGVLLSYLDGASRGEVRLTDGGLADSSGMRGIASAFAQPSSFIGSRIHKQDAIKHLVFIVVNPGAVSTSGAGAVAQRSLDFYRTEAVETVRARITAEQEPDRALLACQQALDRSCPTGPRFPLFPPGPGKHIVEVNFDRIQDEVLRMGVLNIPTTGTLAAPDVSRLISLGEQLLDQSPEFQRLVAALRQ